ncbi:hypothetical protein [Clostridium tyrobutyricum]|uniref:hypothetical protein n=1 Tax=Clostridium tyrobutyricum TaxID=1519 RepID=UPI001C391890|nr:hypothetical protein [Clostridium tyrobutyricum]MBV4423668.1 hypothetical protein [Clostridium tyrobutyricum]
MAIDVSKRTAQIRTAVYGKYVRENIAGGIEDIAGDVNQFEDVTTQRQNDYESNVNKQWSDYKEVMDADEVTRKNNEDTRISNENIRIANEGSRQTVYNDFRNMLNTSEKIGRLPYLFDGGAFGDSGDTNNWVLSMDGGSF